MSKDKRSVHTDALETLGTIITEKEERDAIHLAVENVITGGPLRRGQFVRYEKGYIYSVDREEDSVGIVDPFLTVEVVGKDRNVWLIIKPRTITSLRHVWEHPMFESIKIEENPILSPKEESEQWIRNFAASIPIGYEDLMEGAKWYLSDGEYLNYGELLEGESIPDEFWDHYEVVTGVKGSGNFFACSC